MDEVVDHLIIVSCQTRLDSDSLFRLFPARPEYLNGPTSDHPFFLIALAEFCLLCTNTITIASFLRIPVPLSRASFTLRIRAACLLEFTALGSPSVSSSRGAVGMTAATQATPQNFGRKVTKEGETRPKSRQGEEPQAQDGWMSPSHALVIALRLFSGFFGL